jgi:hypothetical protein
MVEVIGFIISLLALLFLFMRQSVPPPHLPHPTIRSEEEELMEEDPFKELMRAVQKEAAAREAALHPPPVPPAPTKRAKPSPKGVKSSLEDYRLASQIEQRQLKSTLESRHLVSRFHHHEELPARNLALSTSHLRMEEDKIMGPSRVQLAIQRLADRRDMIIYQEIIDKPKSMRFMNLSK